MQVSKFKEFLRKFIYTNMQRCFMVYGRCSREPNIYKV